jgi:hypothetical protein
VRLQTLVDSTYEEDIPSSVVDAERYRAKGLELDDIAPY